MEIIRKLITLGLLSAISTWAHPNECQAERAECFQQCRSLDRSSSRGCKEACVDRAHECKSDARELTGAPGRRSSREEAVPASVPSDLPKRYELNLKKLIKPAEGGEIRGLGRAMAYGSKPLPLKPMRPVEGLKAAPLYLGCGYETYDRSDPKETKQITRSVGFWYHERPALTGLPPETPSPRGANLARALVELEVADIALEQCPATWGEALETIFGSDVWAKVETHSSEFALRQNENKQKWDDGVRRVAERCIANLENQSKSLPPGVAPPLLSEAQRQLACEVHAEIGGVEGHVGQNGAQFVKVVRERLLVKLNDLIGAAKAARPPLQSVTWDYFDRWERGLGGQTLLALQRLNDWFERGNEGASGNPNYELGLTQPYSDLLAAYDDYLDKVGMLDPKWWQSASKALGAGGRSGAKEESTPAGALAMPTSSTVGTRRTIYLTPGAYVVHQMAQDATQAAVALLQLRASNVEFLAGLERAVKSKREEFWSCYAKRCNDKGQSYAGYLEALTNKDISLIGIEMSRSAFMRSGGERVAAGSQPFLGLREIDGGAPAGCANLLSSSVTPVRASLTMTDPNFKMEPTFAKVMGGAPYAKYVRCRDKMEFILRPRQ